MSNINIIDLFAGCGGLSDGFDQTNLYNTLACVEWEKAPCDTLKKRLADKWLYTNSSEIVLRFDIQRTEQLFNGWCDDPEYGNSAGLDSLVKQAVGNVGVIIGGPPCQAYSIAGRIRDKDGMNDDYRNFLFESYIKVVDRYKPKVFIFENVPGIFTAQPGGEPILEKIISSFKDIGYSISHKLRSDGIINCVDYGIPQARKRVIILGVNNNISKIKADLIIDDFYKNILPQYKEPIKTVRDALSDLPKLLPLSKPITVKGKKYSHDYTCIDIKNHLPRMHSMRDIDIFRMLTEDIDNGTERYTNSEALKQLYYELTGKRSNIHKYHVLRWDKPSNTIPAHLYKDGLRHIHPDAEQMRTLTVREAARLQTFDDDFEFLGSVTDQYKMVGNAVPPKLAKIVALSVAEILEKHF